MADDELTEQQAEERRLTARTKELRQRTEALDISRVSYDSAEHEVLRDDIKQHQKDLAKYRAKYLRERP